MSNFNTEDKPWDTIVSLRSETDILAIVVFSSEKNVPVNTDYNKSLASQGIYYWVNDAEDSDDESDESDESRDSDEIGMKRKPRRNNDGNASKRQKIQDKRFEERHETVKWFIKNANSSFKNNRKIIFQNTPYEILTAWFFLKDNYFLQNKNRATSIEFTEVNYDDVQFEDRTFTQLPPTKEDKSETISSSDDMKMEKEAEGEEEEDKSETSDDEQMEKEAEGEEEEDESQTSSSSDDEQMEKEEEEEEEEEEEGEEEEEEEEEERESKAGKQREEIEYNMEIRNLLNTNSVKTYYIAKPLNNVWSRKKIGHSELRTTIYYYYNLQHILQFETDTKNDSIFASSQYKFIPATKTLLVEEKNPYIPNLDVKDIKLDNKHNFKKITWDEVDDEVFGNKKTNFEEYFENQTIAIKIPAHFPFETSEIPDPPSVMRITKATFYPFEKDFGLIYVEGDFENKKKTLLYKFSGIRHLVNHEDDEEDTISGNDDSGSEFTPSSPEDDSEPSSMSDDESDSELNYEIDNSSYFHLRDDMSVWKKISIDSEQKVIIEKIYDAAGNKVSDPERNRKVVNGKDLIVAKSIYSPATSAYDKKTTNQVKIDKKTYIVKTVDDDLLITLEEKGNTKNKVLMKIHENKLTAMVQEEKRSKKNFYTFRYEMEINVLLTFRSKDSILFKIPVNDVTNGKTIKALVIKEIDDKHKYYSTKTTTKNLNRQDLLQLDNNILSNWELNFRFLRRKSSEFKNHETLREKMAYPWNGSFILNEPQAKGVENKIQTIINSMFSNPAERIRYNNNNLIHKNRKTEMKTHFVKFENTLHQKVFNRDKTSKLVRELQKKNIRYTLKFFDKFTTTGVVLYRPLNDEDYKLGDLYTKAKIVYHKSQSIKSGTFRLGNQGIKAKYSYDGESMRFIVKDRKNTKLEMIRLNDSNKNLYKHKWVYGFFVPLGEQNEYARLIYKEEKKDLIRVEKYTVQNGIEKKIIQKVKFSDFKDNFLEPLDPYEDGVKEEIAKFKKGQFVQWTKNFSTYQGKIEKISWNPTREYLVYTVQNYSQTPTQTSEKLKEFELSKTVVDIDSNWTCLSIEDVKEQDSLSLTLCPNPDHAFDRIKHEYLPDLIGYCVIQAIRLRNIPVKMPYTFDNDPKKEILLYAQYFQEQKILSNKNNRHLKLEHLIQICKHFGVHLAFFNEYYKMWQFYNHNSNPNLQFEEIDNTIFIAGDGFLYYPLQPKQNSKMFYRDPNQVQTKSRWNEKVDLNKIWLTTQENKFESIYGETIHTRIQEDEKLHEEWEKYNTDYFYKISQSIPDINYELPVETETKLSHNSMKIYDFADSKLVKEQVLDPLMQSMSQNKNFDPLAEIMTGIIYGIVRIDQDYKSYDLQEKSPLLPIDSVVLFLSESVEIINVNEEEEPEEDKENESSDAEWTAASKENAHAVHFQKKKSKKKRKLPSRSSTGEVRDDSIKFTQKKSGKSEILYTNIKDWHGKMIVLKEKTRIQFSSLQQKIYLLVWKTTSSNEPTNQEL